jgi:hypothetical protein
MAIAVQIIPPARVGVNAINSAAQATAAFENDTAPRCNDHREKDEFGRERRKHLIASRQLMELNAGKQIAEVHIRGVPATR